MSKWKKIRDVNVRHIWKCDDENCDCDKKNPSIDVSPTFYYENGTPECDCGGDMVYVRTEIEVSNMKRVDISDPNAFEFEPKDVEDTENT